MINNYSDIRPPRDPRGGLSGFLTAYSYSTPQAGSRFLIFVILGKFLKGVTWAQSFKKIT